MKRAEAEAILDGDRETAIALLMRIGELVEANRRLEARVAELEHRLNRSSRNSSLPPSADPPSVPGRPSRPRSGRKPGGQSGHPGTTRLLVGPDRVDETRDYWPLRCRGCDRVFELVDWVALGTPKVHQVCELPPLAVTIAEHRLHTVSCACGKTTRASLPAGVTASAFGPRLQAAVATLATRQRLSRRQTAETVQELFGCPVSLGAVDAIIGRVADAVAAPYDELRAQLPKEPVVYADETSWALSGKPHWAWGGFTRTFAVIALQERRNQAAAKALLGEPDGIVCTDRFGGYNHLADTQRQVCWAHLARDFEAVSERRLPADQRLGRQLAKIAKQVFAAYHDYRDHEDPGRLTIALEPVQARLRKLLEPVARGRRAKTAGFAADLLNRWPSLWLFADHPDLVEPTNNAAERGLRPAVIKRKLCFGSHSERGLRATERLLSIDGSCRLQHRSLYTYLADTMTAAAAGKPAPSLISQTPTAA